MDYLQTVQLAIDYIEENLQRELYVEDVARRAWFSVYHFHRIFQSVVGDTVKEYIRKRRLTQAALALLHTDKRILDIAIDFQFESQESFTRSFQQVIGITPGRYRKTQTSVALFRRKSVLDRYLQQMREGLSMKPKIVMKEAFTVVGVECTGLEINLSPNYDQNQNRIPALWGSFLPREKEIGNRINNAVSYGMCIPEENGTFSYMACLEVSDEQDLPEGMVSRTVPASKYAVFTNKGPLSKLPELSKYIYGTWLPESGYELALIPELEVYDERFIDPISEKSELDVYVAIK